MKAGYIAIVGRPNVGKSTLLNRFAGQKVAITANKPQTTRHSILAIKTTETAQFLFIDTPGIHSNSKNALNRQMNRTARGTLADVDVALFLVEGDRWTEEDELVLQLLKKLKLPTILVINKVDLIYNKNLLFPIIEKLSNKFTFEQIIPLSARRDRGLKQLERAIEELLPVGTPFYSADQLTDKSSRFLVAELIREKLTRHLGQELPYATTVEIEHFKTRDDGIIDIAAVVWVERKGQKSIIIGKQGSMLRQIGKESRLDIQQLVGSKVFLQLWVKVREGWADDEQALINLGYN